MKLERTPPRGLNELQHRARTPMSAKGETRHTEGIRYLTQDEVRRLFAIIPKDAVQHRLMLAFAYRFGMRGVEVVSLLAGAVDRTRWEITIQGAKNGLRRVYTIPRDLRPLVRVHRVTGPTFFAGRQGPYTRERFWQVYKAYARKAGLPELGLHALRHSCAVHMLDAGCATEEVRDALRHRRLASSDVYANLSTKRRGQYMRRLEESSAVVKMRGGLAE